MPSPLVSSLFPRAIQSAVAVAALAIASSACGDVITYSVHLTGAAEAPPNASPGLGDGFVTIDTALHTMHLHVDFGGLIGTVSASHIHAATAVAGAGTAGVATTTPTFAGFPLGVTAGTYDTILDMTLASSYNPSYVAAHGGTTASAEIDLFAAFAAGKAYWNIHTTAFPPGEIRGFLTPVPAPGAASVLAIGTLLVARRRRV
ncbi:MAG: CHRD domain-containing protein [Planctomycetota bacterium]